MHHTELQSIEKKKSVIFKELYLKYREAEWKYSLPFRLWFTSVFILITWIPESAFSF